MVPEFQWTLGLLTLKWGDLEKWHVTHALSGHIASRRYLLRTQCRWAVRRLGCVAPAHLARTILRNLGALQSECPQLQDHTPTEPTWSLKCGQMNWPHYSTSIKVSLKWQAKREPTSVSEFDHPRNCQVHARSGGGRVKVLRLAPEMWVIGASGHEGLALARARKCQEGRPGAAKQANQPAGLTTACKLASTNDWLT